MRRRGDKSSGIGPQVVGQDIQDFERSTTAAVLRDCRPIDGDSLDANEQCKAASRILEDEAGSWLCDPRHQ
jgi:hypothetical protein